MFPCMIIAKPNGGLGNRLRVINSAICLSKENENISVKVLWKKDWEMSAGFDGLFKPVREISTIKPVGKCSTLPQ